jgi:hypothetical protein
MTAKTNRKLAIQVTGCESDYFNEEWLKKKEKSRSFLVGQALVVLLGLP